MLILHGSEKVIETPYLTGSKATNDYGYGFYCTKQYDMACEWACRNNRNGFVNHYELSETGLNELNLMDGTHSILEWMALLLVNRRFTLDTQIAVDAREYLLKNFLPDLIDYDIITGYRADDSYFAFAESFVGNGLSLRSLSKALYLGKLGLQTVLVSDKAFSSIRFLKADVANASEYYPRFKTRDERARETYRNEISSASSYEDDIFILDIIRQHMRRDDERIQRIICE